MNFSTIVVEPDLNFSLKNPQPFIHAINATQSEKLDDHLDHLKSHFYKILYTKESCAHLWQNVKKELEIIKSTVNLNHLNKKMKFKNPKEQHLFFLMLKAYDSGDEELKSNFFKEVEIFKAEKKMTFTENEKFQLNNYFSYLNKHLDNLHRGHEQNKKFLDALDAKNRLDPRLYSKFVKITKRPLHKIIQEIKSQLTNKQLKEPGLQLQKIQNFTIDELKQPLTAKQIKKFFDTLIHNKNSDDNNNDIQAGNDLSLLDQQLNNISSNIWGLILLLSLIEYNLSASQALHVAKDSEADLQRSHGAQEASNELNELIASLKSGDAASIPDAIKKKIKELGIKIDGMDIDDYIKKHAQEPNEYEDLITKLNNDVQAAYGVNDVMLGYFTLNDFRKLLDFLETNHIINDNVYHQYLNRIKQARNLYKQYVSKGGSAAYNPFADFMNKFIKDMVPFFIKQRLNPALVPPLQIKKPYLDAIKAACDQVVTTSNQSSTEAQIKITQANNGATNWQTLAKTMLSAWYQLLKTMMS